MSKRVLGLPRFAGVLVWMLVAGLAAPVAAQNSPRKGGQTGAKRQAATQAAKQRQQAARAANARTNQTKANRAGQAARRNPAVVQRRGMPNAAGMRQQGALAGRAAGARAAAQTTATRLMGRDGGSTTVSLSAGAARGASATSSPLQLVLAGMDPAARRATMEHVRGLDQEQRRALIRELQAVPEGERTGWLARKAGASEPASQPPPLAADRATTAAKGAPSPEPPASREPAAGHAAASFRMSGLGVGVPLPAEGTPAPDFRLTSPGGTSVGSVDLRGRTVVLQFGCITSPVYRGTIAAMNDLRGRASTDTQFLVVYTQEAHPKGGNSPYSDREWIPLKNVEDKVLVPQPGTLDERMENARRVAATMGEGRAVAVDGMDNAVWRAFGGRANSVFVIAPDGVIRAAWEYPDPAALERYLRDPRLRLAAH